MRILIFTSLGFEKSVARLCRFLETDGHRVWVSPEPWSVDDIKQHGIDLIVCHNYGKIVSPEMIEAVEGRAVNLHPSLLPHCRGLHPILWALATRAPMGVSLHFIDAEIDTGPLIAQSLISLNLETETLRTCYKKVQDSLEALFFEAWPDYKNWQCKATHQKNGGSYFGKRDYQRIKNAVESWDMPVLEFVRRVSGEIERTEEL